MMERRQGGGSEGGSAMAGAGPGWEVLQGVIGGEVVAADTPPDERTPRPFNARFDSLRPKAVVRVTSPEDVAETVAVVRRHGLALAARSGGHDFAGRSSTDGVLVDLTPMHSVSVADGVVTVGTGTRLGELNQTMAAHDLAVPAGTCPPVGIAGLTLGGGLGLLGRRDGLTSDHLVAARVVGADGRILDCDEQHHPELFWALRGAGAGQFGIVTSLAFRPRPAPAATNFRLVWPPQQAAAVIAAWPGWSPTGPDELAASLVLAAPAEVDRPPAVNVFGVLLGGQADATELLERLVDRVGAAPATTFVKQLSFWETLERWGRLDHTTSDPAGVAHRARTRPRPTTSSSPSSSATPCPTTPSRPCSPPWPRTGSPARRASSTSPRGAAPTAGSPPGPPPSSTATRSTG
jgi:FAD/FMN-containing dehydrogenase